MLSCSPLQALQLLRQVMPGEKTRVKKKKKKKTRKTQKWRTIFRCLNIRSCELRAAIPLLCVRGTRFFTDDSKSNSQDRRCTLRIGDVPLRASSWRRAARRVFYYESGGGGGGRGGGGGGGGGLVTISQHHKTCRDLLLASAGVVGGWKRGSSPRNVESQCVFLSSPLFLKQSVCVWTWAAAPGHRGLHCHWTLALYHVLHCAGCAAAGTGRHCDTPAEDFTLLAAHYYIISDDWRISNTTFLDLDPLKGTEVDLWTWVVDLKSSISKEKWNKEWEKTDFIIICEPPACFETSSGSQHPD